MKHLCDSNVFLAMAVGQHAHHPLAAAWFGGLAPADTAVFCRATKISFLRLLTQKIAPGHVPLSNEEAWNVFDRLNLDDAVMFEEEPPGLDPVWRKLSGFLRVSEEALTSFSVFSVCFCKFILLSGFYSPRTRKAGIH